MGGRSASFGGAMGGGAVEGEDCTACGVGCGGNGGGAMSYVGCGQGGYVQDTTFRYVGHGGDFDVVRRKRDFTCILGCCLIPLLLLLPCLLWWLCQNDGFDCDDGFETWEISWGMAKQQFCCAVRPGMPNDTAHNCLAGDYSN